MHVCKRGEKFARAHARDGYRVRIHAAPGSCLRFWFSPFGFWFPTSRPSESGSLPRAQASAAICGTCESKKPVQAEAVAPSDIPGSTVEVVPVAPSNQAGEEKNDEGAGAAVVVAEASGPIGDRSGEADGLKMNDGVDDANGPVIENVEAQDVVVEVVWPEDPPCSQGAEMCSEACWTGEDCGCRKCLIDEEYRQCIAPPSEEECHTICCGGMLSEDREELFKADNGCVYNAFLGFLVMALCPLGIVYFAVRWTFCNGPGALWRFIIAPSMWVFCWALPCGLGVVINRLSCQAFIVVFWPLWGTRLVWVRFIKPSCETVYHKLCATICTKISLCVCSIWVAFSTCCADCWGAICRCIGACGQVICDCVEATCDKIGACCEAISDCFSTYICQPIGRCCGWICEHVCVPIGQGISKCCSATYDCLECCCFKPILRPFCDCVGKVCEWISNCISAVCTALGNCISAVCAAFYTYVLTPIGQCFSAIAGFIYAYVLVPIGTVLNFIFVEPVRLLSRAC